MPDVAPILDYPTPQAPPQRLTLEDGPDFARIVFPVKPKWAYWLPIALCAGAALMITATPLINVVIVWRAFAKVGFATKAQLWHALRISLLATWSQALLLWIWAMLDWWRYRCWGRVPRTLIANKDGLSLSYLGWWRMREKRWPASDIAGIDVRPIRGNLTWWKTAAYLFVRLKSGNRRQFRLISSDPRLPGHIEQSIKAALGCPRPDVI